MTVLNIGVFSPSQMFHSAQLYLDNVSKKIKALGAKTVPFSEKQPLPKDVDLYWDPRSGGGFAPCRALINSGKPVVVTVHGVAPMSMKWSEFYKDFLHAVVGGVHNIVKLYLVRLYMNNLPQCYSYY